MKIARSRWIGSEGAAFTRVGLAFRAYGLPAPQPDIPGGQGAYVMNITNQYLERSRHEILALVEYGLLHTREGLEADGKDSERLLYTLPELGAIYEDRYGEQR